MNPEQISAEQRSRLAYVYVRQSSPHQVMNHRESQIRQRGLETRAQDLGWQNDRVIIIEDDTGTSASRSSPRSAFEAMVADAALGNVGLIVSLEVSRLSRGNRNWYHLLDICAVTRTLIADADGLYDPRSYNDRLLLGLKGTMSEAELHIMKERLVEAVRSKAKRGEFRMPLPPGYVWDEADRMRKTPDEQVVSAIALIFERFARLGCVHQVQCSLADDHIQVPVLNGPKKSVRFALPGYSYLHRMLTNPTYAGAYVFGKRQVEEVLDASQRPRKRTRHRPQKDWHSLIKDHHEGYITFETYEKNQRLIAQNRRGQPGPGAPREGSSLIQGLVLCGQCGRRMRVSYGRRGRLIRYSCVTHRKQTGGPVCQAFGSLRLERALERLLLEALEPLGVEAMIAASVAQVAAGEEEKAHWKQRVERARYEVGLARRQYDTVDPENRLVARELERRWENALEDLDAIQKDADRHLGVLEKPLTREDQTRLARYSHDLPSLWNAQRTLPRDRKRIVRCLIENVVVTVPKDGPNLQAAVHWVGGEMTEFELQKGRTGKHRHVAEVELVDLITTLAKEFSDEQIAFILRRKKILTPKDLQFTTQRVTSTRTNHGIPGQSVERLAGKDVYTADKAAEILGTSRATVVRWVQDGLLHGSQVTPQAPWHVRVTEDDRRRLTAAAAPVGWLPLKGAAQALGVSQPTVLQRLKDGRMDAVRVRVGRRSGWRINVPQTTCDDQPTLFDPATS